MIEVKSDLSTRYYIIYRNQRYNKKIGNEVFQNRNQIFKIRNQSLQIRNEDIQIQNEVLQILNLNTKNGSITN